MALLRPAGSLALCPGHWFGGPASSFRCLCRPPLPHPRPWARSQGLVLVAVPSHRLSTRGARTEFLSVATQLDFSFKVSFVPTWL